MAKTELRQLMKEMTVGSTILSVGLTLLPMLWTSGCSSPSESYPPFPAVIYGKVTARDGTPVAAARLHVLGYKDACTSGLQWNDHNASYFTRDDGSFRISPPTYGGNTEFCFHVQVIPPASVGLPTITTGAFQASPRSDPYRLSYDSTEVIIVFP